MMSLKMYLMAVSLILAGLAGVDGVQGRKNFGNCRPPLDDILNGGYEVNGVNSADLTCHPGFYPTPPTTIKCSCCGRWIYPVVKPICKTSSSMGTAFVAVFLLSTLATNQGPEEHSLTITTEDTANVSITSKFESINMTVFVNCSKVIQFETSIVLKETIDVTNKVLAIDSDVGITVRVLTYRNGKKKAADATLIHPTTYLSNYYIIMTANETSHLAVIAIADNTSVQIFDQDGVLFYSGTLDQFEVYSYRNPTDDLTGFQVHTSTNAAVLCGYNFAVVPNYLSGSQDAGFVQMLGVQYFYKKCIMGPFIPDAVYMFKIVASQNDTEVTMTINGTTINTNLNAYEYYEKLVNNGFPVEIESSKPILVSQFSLTSTATHRNPGDASMVQCLDPSKFLNNYKFYVYSSDLFEKDRYVRIVIMVVHVQYLRLNGDTFAATTTKLVGNYYILYLKLNADVTYTIATTKGQTFGCDLYATNPVIQVSANNGFLL